MIRDYVEMYRYRIDPDHTEIRMEEQGDPEGLMIAPMLLIPFIENSFKHGLPGGQEKSFIAINTDIRDDKLLLKVCNSCKKSEPEELEQRKGIGIENTRQRLELLYPGRYMLDIKKSEGTFSLSLSIELKHK